MIIDGAHIWLYVVGIVMSYGWVMDAVGLGKSPWWLTMAVCGLWPVMLPATLICGVLGWLPDDTK